MADSRTERIKNAIERHPDWDDRRLANSITMPRGQTVGVMEIREVRGISYDAPRKPSSAKPPEECGVTYLRGEVARLEREAAYRHKAKGEMSEIAFALQSAVSVAEPPRMVYRETQSSKSPCTHVLHLTDLHYGSVIDADEIDGFNEYSPEIAERRLQRLGELIIKNTTAQRHCYNVPNLHILATGDYISGGIHPELNATNAFPCPVQAVKCGYAIGALVAMFAPHFKHVTIDIVTLDNHGRLTVKPQASQGGENNWGYVTGSVVNLYCADIPNVRVNVHAKPTALVHIGPEDYLCFHGHQIKGFAGLPYYGFDRRAAMEAIKRMGVPERAFTKLIVGHYHHAMNGQTWQLGGSLSGTDAFDHSCGRHSKPHQTSWMVHPTHGEFNWTRWYL